MMTAISKSTTTFLLVVLLILVAAEPVLSRVTQLTGFSLQDYPRALCLDGSSGRYYHAPGRNNGTKKWLIEFQGGGWCGSLDACLDRTKTVWGSSSAWPLLWKRGTPLFDDHPRRNPLAHDWNKVYVRYCDGFGFSGNATMILQNNNGTVLYSHGYDLLEAALQDLLHHRNLAHATDVLVSGCSAGGWTAMLQCDFIAERIRQNAPDVKRIGCAPESGFFVNYDGTPSYLDVMTQGLQFHQPILNAKCVLHEANDEDSRLKCLLAEHVVKYLETPLFVMQPVFDTWARGAIRLNRGRVEEVNRFGDEVTRAVLDGVLKERNSNGVYLDSCARHCLGDNVEIRGVTKMQALWLWWETLQQPQNIDHVYIQEKQYPCEACCDGPFTTSSPSSVPSDGISAYPSSGTSGPSIAPSDDISVHFINGTSHVENAEFACQCSDNESGEMCLDEANESLCVECCDASSMPSSAPEGENVILVVEQASCAKDDLQNGCLFLSMLMVAATMVEGLL